MKTAKLGAESEATSSGISSLPRKWCSCSKRICTRGLPQRRSAAAARSSARTGSPPGKGAASGSASCSSSTRRFSTSCSPRRVVTALLGEWVDASVIFAVVFLNAVVGYLQEAKAEKAIEALAQMVVTEATVRRDGRKQRVPSEELVPGDVVLLQSGDKVPADLRLFHVRNLQVDESALTGESVPVEKHGDALALDTILAERSNLAFAGTLVTYGQAEGVVWAIGDQTEMGRIAWLISEAADLSTPLTRKIAHFSKLLLWAILALAAVTFALGIWRGEKPVEMFMAAVALAVGAIPEGLPAAVTITLAIGVSRMARRRAIIRKLPAVETLGSTTVICSDKTGTLTENQMTVQAIYAGGKLYEVTGSGYEPHGEILAADGQPVDPAPRAALTECLRAGLLCNDSQLVREEERRAVQGDPTEAALIVAAEKAGLAHAETQHVAAPARRHPVRVRAPVHGHAARRRQGRAHHLQEGRRRTSARPLHDALDDRGEAVASTTPPCHSPPRRWPRAACACSPSPAAWPRANNGSSSIGTSPADSPSSACKG